MRSEPAPLRLPAVAVVGADDVALAAAFGGGDLLELERIVRAHAAEVLSVLRRYAGAPQEVRDLALEAFGLALRAAQRALRRDPQRSIPFGRWLLRAALKLANERLREEFCFGGGPLDPLGSAPARRGPGERRLMGGGAAGKRIRNGVLALPRRLREVLTLRIDPELPFPEIARVLRITDAAVVLDFHEAIGRLRREVCEPPAAEGACPHFEVLLSSRAVGALDRAETARVEAHLARCGGCSAVADGNVRALELASVALAPGGDRATIEDLASSVVARVERSERRRQRGRHLLVAGALAALSVVLIAATVLVGQAAYP